MGSELVDYRSVEKAKNIFIVQGEQAIDDMDDIPYAKHFKKRYKQVFEALELNQQLDKIQGAYSSMSSRGSLKFPAN